MDCAEAKLQIDSYVAGELAADRKGPLEEHLAACAECRLDSELTRASKSQPVGSDPDAAPAAFVESIRPDVAGADPDPVAAPQGGAPPALAPGGSDGSWSLESIFGPGGSGGSDGAGSAAAESAAGSTWGLGPDPSPPSLEGPASDSDLSALAERAAAAAAPLPDHALPSVLAGAAAPRRSEELPASDAPTWDFEPADVKGGAKPPQGSLFFAEEALSRSGAKKKSGVSRILLWGAGALLGVGLLALSIWIAMTVRQPLPGSVPTMHPMRAGAGPEDPGLHGTTPAPDAAANLPVDSVAVAPPPPASSEPPAVEVSEAPPPAPTSRVTPPPSPHETVARSAPVAKPPISRPSVPKPQTTKSPIATRTHEVATAPAPKRPVASETGEAPAPPRSPAAPDAGAPGSGAALSETAPPPPPVSAEKAPSATEPSASAPAPPASSDAIERPIDRLHLATLNAEQNADLVALRKLRESWRTFVKGSLGPDRARAKRELADCLWAIQTLTSKSSDQREALAAYRDYILNAPAGGADTRTVARMRQLEDAVAESR